MKKVRLMALLAALSVAVSVLPVLVHGDVSPADATETEATETYNPEEDPLITLSYIEKVIKPAYDEKIEDLTKEVGKLNDAVFALQNALTEANKKIDELSAVEPSTDAGIGQYEVVYLEEGAKLMAKTPCEIILRTGSAIAVSIISNGLNDITDGTEILNANPIPLYHALIVPRGDDGRGIQITSADAYVMVRGEYEIVQ